jgi:LysM repeat protein
MKRRTRLIIIGCATLGGTITTAALAASAMPLSAPSRVLKPALTSPAPAATNPIVHRSVQRAVHRSVQRVVHRSVPARLPTVNVQPGDSLSTIGARTYRTWVQLAAYNHIGSPDLIYAGQVLTIPPATYVPVAVSISAPPATSGNSNNYGASPVSHYTPIVSGTHSTYTPASSGPSSSGSGIWGCIAAHESGGNPGANTGNGYYGMYQDTQSSWAAAGGLAYAPRADLASAAAQTAVNQRIQAQQGWSAWPSTSSMCGA